ncbi:MAG TPA: DUF3300 domain-containing protein [Xanthobacteraceae bacterium]|nr:DUF3300 domain-containing protein [Xanthobacteraceae bacterium]
MNRLSRLMMIILLWSVPLAAMAETSQPAAAPSQPLLKEPELDQLVAPIALYPDQLLSQVLIASTYPLEVVQADRWAKSNKNLKGDALTTALGKQSWDDSIKSLAQVPDVLSMMGEQLDWTQKLGDAVLAQQADVMDAIQRLRGRAQANNKLNTTKEQTVTVKTEGQKQYITIEPTSPNQIYVPYYQPATVYGAWPYPAYTPYYFPPPYGYFPGAALATGMAFATGVAIGGAIWGNCNWGNNSINVNKNVNVNNINRNNANFSKWEHNADHRHGVKYNNADVSKKFAKNDIQAGKGARQDFRGKDGQQVLNTDRDRPGAGDRDRPGAGDRDRPGAGDRDRPGGGDRDRSGAGDRDRQGGGRDASKGGGGQKASQRPSQGGGQKASQRPSQGGGQKSAQRPSQPTRDTGFSNVQSGARTQAQSNRGRQSMGGGGGGGAPRVSGGGGGGPRAGGGGGGGGRGGGGGGRRSDVTLKHDITLLGHLDNGLGFYRFSYVGSDKAYVGVMAQEVQTVMPEAVVRGRDGYLRVFYEKLGLEFQTYDRWVASGAQLPTARTRH